MTNTSAKEVVSSYQFETHCRDKIPYASFIDEATIETKNGNLLQIIKIDGLMAETLDDELIDAEKHIRNHLLMSLTDSSTSFYFHTIRRRVSPQLDAEFNNDYLQRLHNKWQQKLNIQDFYINEHYITVVTKPPASKIRRLSDVINNLSALWSRKERDRYRNHMVDKLNKITKHVIVSLAGYNAHKLINEKNTDNQGESSASLTFLSYLINLSPQACLAPEADLATVLPLRRLFFDSQSGTIAFRAMDNSVRYGAMLAIKQYSHTTYAGMLDKLLDSKSEMIMCQSFSPIEKQAIRNQVKETKRNMAQGDDGETSASHQIASVLDDIGSSEATLGEHHMTILCVADSLTALNDKLSDLDATMNQIGMIAVREDAGLKAAFFSMLPGNHAYLTRKALILSKNIAGLASFHNAHHGKRSGNVWGDAITVLEAISGSPYYFNFHVMDVGNTFMIGPMGSGKTLLEAFLLAESMRFGGRLIAFDKDRGLEIFIRAQGGEYAQLKMGKPTGFAPFQLDDTKDNRYFLFKLMRKIATLSSVEVDSTVEDALRHAIEGAFKLPKNERTLRNIVPFLGMRQARSLRAAFENWVLNGSYSWVFDCEVDTLKFSSSVMGFDMTSVLEDTLVASVIYDYLFYRIEQLMDGSRMRIVVAEGWRALQDESFREKIRDWSSTPRKKNAFLIMDTQSPADIAQSELACKIIQETVTQIYFSNPSAEHDHYVGRFKLSEKEYRIVKSLNKSARFFLLKQGKHSAVVRADLREGFDEDIAVLSGREKNVRLLDGIRAKAGDAPADWLPIYLENIKVNM